MNQYVHGYSEREARRLQDQSQIIEKLLHGDTFYPPGSRVLEAGCGVGAQTLILAGKSPGVRITSLDISRRSLLEARNTISSRNLPNVRFLQASVLDLPFPESSFDHVFICFVLEHLKEPARALGEVRKVLKKGGSLTVIEGDHGSFFWHPETPESRLVWQSFVTAQSSLGHDPLIGRRLFPLLKEAGFDVLKISPRNLYTDGMNTRAKSSGLNKIFIPMLGTGREQALELNLIDRQTWTEGIRHFRQAAKSPDSSFFYTWFKALAVK